MNWSQGLEEGSPAYNIAASANQRVRVVAGPGAGKSFAMKRRVARLLDEGVNPRSILPVTFTRVAAEDLHRELVGMGVEGCDELKGTTLHSLALRILMRNHVLDATGRTPRPLNEYEMKPLEVDLNAFGGLRNVRDLIRAYQSGWARLQHEAPGFAQTPQEQAFAAELIRWLRYHEAMLIGEVIPQLYQYLRNNPAADERTEFTHILVDEYQDLNKSEQSVIDLLSDNAEVCIVGDDDQSIYSFKHAHPDGIREWIEVNNNADDLALTDCRRCPTTVVHMANSLIAHNELRPVPRQLEPMEENGEGVVEILQYGELDAEVEGIANRVVELIDAGAAPGDILILAQRGVIGTPIYEALLEREIPVKSYYSESELDNIEAQKSFALLKILVDRDDRVALRWLLGLGSNNWRSPSYQRLRDHCSEHDISPWQALTNIVNGELAIPHTSALVKRFNSILEDVVRLEECEDVAALVDELLPEEENGTRELRLTALKVLDEFEIESAEELLSCMVSAISAPEVPTVIEEVRIMSLHKSKGLSSPITIVAGCMEGIMPMRPPAGLNQMAQDAYMEEQRRLFYVGITRVKASPQAGHAGMLILTYSQRMLLATAMGAGIAPASVNYGIANLNASRFIHELGQAAPAPIAG